MPLNKETKTICGIFCNVWIWLEWFGKIKSEFKILGEKGISVVI